MKEEPGNLLPYRSELEPRMEFVSCIAVSGIERAERGQ